MSAIEITCPIANYIAEGSKIDISDYQENSGGHAGNIAYLLGKWGSEVYIASMMGADDYASKIKKDFENANIKTDYIETSYDKKTALSIILLNEQNRFNTAITIANNLKLKKYSFLIEPDVIVSDGNDFQATVSALEKFPKAKSVLMVTKPTNETSELCRYAQNIIFNERSAMMIANIQIDYNNSATLVAVYNKLKQKYDNANIIITLGEKGCVYALNNQVKIIPPINNDIVDTYGAGDIFVGAFCHGLSRNFDIEKNVTFSTIAASFSVTKMTSRASIPSLTEVTSYYEAKMNAQGVANTQAQTNQQSAPQAQATPQQQVASQPAQVQPQAPVKPEVNNQSIAGSDNSLNMNTDVQSAINKQKIVKPAPTNANNSQQTVNPNINQGGNNGNPQNPVS
jgi:sugar/nucleoside kinase (ribokinase family)